MELNLVTERLRLRPFDLKDANRLEQLINDIDIASTTIGIPHPYPDGAGETFVIRRNEASENGHGYFFAIINNENDDFMGGIGIHIDKENNKGELAYWIRKPYWGYGYMTEAAKRIVEFAFKDLNLNRVYAGAMTKNPASSNVMKKIGMIYEGTLRNHYLKWDEYEDIAYYGMLKKDYIQTR